MRASRRRWAVRGEELNAGFCGSTGHCTVNAGTCYEHCTINTGYCGTNGDCTINTSVCLNAVICGPTTTGWICDIH